VQAIAGRLESVLGTALALCARAYAGAITFALDGIGNITLPGTSTETESDAAELRAAASLYVAAELEAAQFLPVAELLAGLAASGGLPGEPDARAAEALAHFWKARHERTSPKERRALYGRLFGTGESAMVAPPQDDARGGTNEDFDGLFIDLCETLYKLDEGALGGKTPAPEQGAKLAAAANEVIDSIRHHAGGMTLFLAKDILTALRQATSLLHRREIQALFGARDAADLVGAAARRYLHLDPDVQTHLQRASAGAAILAWLAEAAGSLGGTTPLDVTLDDPVIAAAATWLQTSLRLGEEAQAAPGQTVDAGAG
jgi:hypothetical protein